MPRPCARLLLHAPHAYWAGLVIQPTISRCTMPKGRKKLSQEERRANLKANSYRLGAHAEEDGIKGKDKLMESSKELQQRALTIWDEYVLHL